MSKVYAMIANGTEEVECLAVVDILRRTGVETVIVSVDGETIVSSHGVKITADTTLAQVDLRAADLIFVPGGMPGSVRLGECAELISAIADVLKTNKRVAAICAAPSTVLGQHGFLNGKKAICFPGHESGMLGATVECGARVVTDGNITTARGLGCAIDLGLELVRLLVGADKAEEIGNKIQK